MFGELEHLKIKPRLIDEMFPSLMGEYCVFEVIGDPSIFKLIRKPSVLRRVLGDFCFQGKNGEFPDESVRITV